jgi:hypothetical protein
MSGAERAIKILLAENPDALRLAELVSFAVLIEPALLRRMRLELLKGVDAGAEADLWLSPLVQTRSPEGISLLPGVAELLRQRLAQQPDLLEQAWNLTSQMHAGLPPTLLLEEELNKLSVNPDDRALQRIADILHTVAATLVGDEERWGLANWAARALPRLPETIRKLDPARVLAMVSYLRLGAHLPVTEDQLQTELPDWIAWALPKDLPLADLCVQFTVEGIVFGATPLDPEHVIRVPATNPLIVEVSWSENGRRRVEQLLLQQGEQRTFKVPTGEIHLRTVLGDRYTVTPLPVFETEHAGPVNTMPSEIKMRRPLCFVIMPFGRKTNFDGKIVDFDRIYRDLLAPAIRAAGLEPVRADEEMTDGVIHKPLFERLLLCEYAVADLTTNNANVFYELGIRHAVRPRKTVLVFGESTSLHFDLALVRAIPYRVNSEGTPVEAERFQRELVSRLREETELADSPLFQLVEGYTAPALDNIKTDIFREMASEGARLKRQIANALQQGPQALRAIEEQLGQISMQDSGVVSELLLAYRAASAWDEMLALVEKMSRPLAATVMVQQQLVLALNRTGKNDEAEKILLRLLTEHGPDRETLGRLGSIYKERWDQAKRTGSKALARSLLDRAIETYLQGFETDWREAYPGINALTLMEIKEPPDPRRAEILPIVTYSVRQNMKAGKFDYWSYATLLELAFLAADESGATDAFKGMLEHQAEPWQLDTTANNIRLILEAKAERGIDFKWMHEIRSQLFKSISPSA